MKKRLLIATDCFLPRWDGIARFLYEIIPKMEDKFDITIICPDFSGEKIKFDNVKIYYFKPLLRVADISMAFPEKKLIQTIVKKSDIIFTQTIGPIGTTVINIAKKENKKIASYVHSIEWELFSKSVGGIFRNIIYNYTKLKAKKFYSKCSKIIVPSQEIAEIFDWMRILPKKIVVHLGTNSKKFCPASDKNLMKKELNIPEDKLIIGYVGRIAREKDVLTLYHAFVRIRKEYQNALLLIIGNGLNDLIYVMSKKNVIILPAQNNIVPYYQIMDIFVQPSLTETTSLTVMEAMSCGLPVISTKVGFIKNYIIKDVNGMFFEKHNAYSLSTKLEIMITNKDLREKLGKNARETILNHYQWDNTANEISKILENM